MEDVLDPTLTPAKKKAFERRISVLLDKMADDIRETKKTNKEIDRLRKATERSHEQLRKIMARFDSH